MMKLLIVTLAVSVVAVSAQHWGQAAPVQDTPEVAAAKAAHYAALARSQPQGQPQQAQWGQPQQSQQRWNGPLALPPGFDQNGAPLPVRDTAEVAAERAKHFNLVGGFGAPPNYNQYQPQQQQQQWNAPPQQQQWNQPQQQQQWNAPPQQQWNQPQQQQWNQPQPQWNAYQQAQNTQGLPQDTPEVAAAKAAHLAAHTQLHGR